MVKRIKFGQWSLLVHLTKTTADIDIVWHPKTNIDLDINVMSFGTYNDLDRLYTSFEKDLRDKYTELYAVVERNKFETIELSNGLKLNHDTLLGIVANIIDYINFDRNDEINLSNDKDVVYAMSKDIEHQITDDITITYTYIDIDKLNKKAPDAKIYLNITSNTFGCIFDNPVLLDGIEKFIDSKLMEHVTEMQNNLVNAIYALKSFRGEVKQ